LLIGVNNNVRPPNTNNKTWFIRECKCKMRHIWPS